MQIVLATSNEHKVKEINEMAEGTGIEFVLPPSGFDVEENGKTFEENSKIKALAAWKISKTWTLADDSGLCIEALNGKPGLYSARYETTPQRRIARVLSEMEGKKNRRAKFVCAMTLINPQGDVVFSCKGVCVGTITTEPSGNNGFGYDPIFFLEDKNKTIAELSDVEKNAISHRSHALTQVLGFITLNFQ